MLNQHLLTCSFATEKAKGNVEELGHEIVNGEEVEVFRVVSLVLNPMMTPVILKRRISDGEWISMENEEDIVKGYREFMSEVSDYINSLEEPIQRGEADPLTEEEWTAAIKREMVDFDEKFTDEQIGWIIERLTDDGYVKEGELYEINMNPYMENIEFRGTLEEAKNEAEEMIAYNQYNIVIFKGGEEVTRRSWCGVSPDPEEDENIIEIGNGFYSDWT